MYIVAKNQIQALTNASNGSIVKFITKGDVENITLLVPPNEKLCSFFNTVIAEIEAKEKENQELTALRDWLLPLLMNGQARVV